MICINAGLAAAFARKFNLFSLMTLSRNRLKTPKLFSDKPKMSKSSRGTKKKLRATFSLIVCKHFDKGATMRFLATFQQFNAKPCCFSVWVQRSLQLAASLVQMTLT